MTADSTTDDGSLVLIVDDDDVLRSALGNLLRSADMKAALFGSATELIEHGLPDAPCCLLLDVRLGGPSGLDLQTRLSRMGLDIPIVFMTGYGDVPMTTAAMRAGAEAFISKPFDDQELLDVVCAALEKDRLRRRGRRAR